MIQLFFISCVMLSFSYYNADKLLNMFLYLIFNLIVDNFIKTANKKIKIYELYFEDFLKNKPLIGTEYVSPYCSSC